MFAVGARAWEEFAEELLPFDDCLLSKEAGPNVKLAAITRPYYT
jgi:hypothetical protein